MKTIFFVREIFKKTPGLFTANTLLLIFVSAVEAVSIFALAPVVDFFISSDPEKISPITRQAITVVKFLGLPATLGIFIAAFLILNFLGSGLQVLIRYLVLKIKYSVVRMLMTGAFEDFFRAKWYFFTSSKQGTLLNTFIKEINVVADALSAMGFFFTALFQFILYLAVPFFISWKVALASVSTALIAALPFFLLGKINYRLGKVNVSTANQMNSVIHESFSMAKSILGFGNQAKSTEMLGETFDAHKKVTIKLQTLRIAVPLMYYPVGMSVLVITLFAARNFEVPLSATAVLLYSFLKVVPSIGKMAEWKNYLDSALPSYEQVMELRNRARRLAQSSGARIFEGFKKEISIDGASFSYPGRKPVLESIDIKIPKGKMVAFVGASGGGKTTLIDMIMGFNEPHKGRIAVDGVTLQEFDINSYRRRIGYVAQNAALFNVTIRENFLWVNKKATDEEIKQACRQANADEFIEKFPKGYDTVVGDRGIRLSGGQVQRVALAMAMVRKPEILILDEATSALDAHSERLIQQAVEAIAREITVIVVAHRLSTIKHSDYIYVVEDSGVIERGTFVELIGRQDSKFKKMCQMQNVL